MKSFTFLWNKTMCKNRQNNFLVQTLNSNDLMSIWNRFGIERKIQLKTVFKFTPFFIFSKFYFSLIEMDNNNMKWAIFFNLKIFTVPLIITIFNFSFFSICINRFECMIIERCNFQWHTSELMNINHWNEFQAFVTGLILKVDLCFWKNFVGTKITKTPRVFNRKMFWGCTKNSIIFHFFNLA